VSLITAGGVGVPPRAAAGASPSWTATWVCRSARNPRPFSGPAIST